MRLGVPTISCQFNPEPVYDWTKIRIGFSIDDGPLETAARIDRCEVPLKEHYHVGSREVYCLPDLDVFHACIFGKNGTNRSTSGSAATAT